jgi:hypothetical protein
MSDILANLYAELLALSDWPEKYELSVERLALATEAMRLHQRSLGAPIYYQTPAGLAMVENLAQPLPPMDGLMFRGVALRMAPA